MLPCGFIFGMVIPLNLVEPSSFVIGDSVLLVKNLGGICLVCQSGFNGMVSSMTASDGVFRYLLSCET
jgi:hypothetical protein